MNKFGGATMSREFIKVTQGPAVLADSVALKKDKDGLTNPNLHRRIKVNKTTGENEYLPREYELSVRGVDSYRSTKMFIYDEESTTTETP